MADIIAKLQVDSSQYDGKLKTAIEQMTKMEHEVRRTGATFAYADKEELAFVKSLGSLESSSTSAKTKMMEYTNAITSLTATYRAMTEEEKKSDFGKGLSASIDELKVKAATLKDVMSDTNIEIKNLASDTSFTDGIGLMTRTVGSCAAAITAWTGDSKEMEAVIKDLAKIGATVAAIDSLTKAFQKQNLVLLKNPYVAAAAGVVALGVAIGKLIQKSQELDGVQKTLNDVQAKGRDNAAKEITRIETLNNILHDNTRSLDERKAALAEIQSLVPEYHGALTKEGELINDNTDVMNGYIDSLQRAALAQAAFDKMVELQKQKLEKQVKLDDAQKELERQQTSASAPVTREQMMAQAGSGRNVLGAVESTKQTLVDAAQKQVDDLNAEIKEFNDQLDALQKLVKPSDLESPTTGKGGNTAATGGVTTKDLNPLQEAQRKISELSTEALTADEERREVIRQEIEGLQAQVAAYKQIQEYVQGINKDAEPQEIETTVSRPNMSAFEKLQQSIRIQQADAAALLDENTLKTLLGVAIQNGINGLDLDFSRIMDEMQEGLDISPEAWRELEAKINEQLEALNLKPIKLDVETGGLIAADKQVKSTTQAWQAAASAVSTVGGALQQIEDPAAKIAGIVAAAVAQVALTFAMSLKGTVTPWDWIAAALAGTTTMISTITAIKSVTSAKGYAGGGMVEGTSYSGDNIVARLNAGEGVLTSQGVQNAEMMASIVEGGQQGGGSSSSFVTGENIVLGVNNFLGRSGQGEIVTTSMLRRAGINL